VFDQRVKLFPLVSLTPLKNAAFSAKPEKLIGDIVEVLST
jgi:hypothetical protein